MESKTYVCGLIVLLLSTGLASVASAQTSWERAYGGTSSDEGWSVQQTSDGGYIIAGSTESFGVGTPDSANVYLIKTNAQGDTLWTRTYGGRKEDVGNSVQQTTDGGYIVAGRTRSFGAGDFDVYLIKTNAAGDTVWARAYGGTFRDQGLSARQTTDGGYIVAGQTMSGTGNFDVYLIKTNAAGDILWTRTYGGSDFDQGFSVRQTADGGYIVAGIAVSSGAHEDVYLVKTDASGDTLWTRTYGGAGIDEGRSVQQTPDGGCIIAGRTTSFGAGGYDSYLIKTNSTGDTLWTRTHGGTGGDWGYSVHQTTDGGYIIAGSTISFGAGGYDAYLVKTDSLGNVGVLEESPKPQVTRGRIGTTVLTGASGIRRLASCVVFDVMGRRVHHPKPGIYFLRTVTTAAPRKVLLVE